MERRLAAGDLHHVGLLLVAHDAIEHGFNLVERAEFGPVLPAARVADGAGQIARVA